MGECPADAAVVLAPGSPENTARRPRTSRGAESPCLSPPLLVWSTRPLGFYFGVVTLLFPLLPVVSRILTSKNHNFQRFQSLETHENGGQE